MLNSLRRAGQLPLTLLRGWNKGEIMGFFRNIIKSLGDHFSLRTKPGDKVCFPVLGEAAARMMLTEC
jgi:hypothetical protein